MNLDDWNKLKSVVIVSETLDRDTACRMRILNVIDLKIRELSEVRPVLTPAPVRHNPWVDSACSPYDIDDVWIDSGSCW